MPFCRCESLVQLIERWSKGPKLQANLRRWPRRFYCVSPLISFYKSAWAGVHWFLIWLKFSDAGRTNEVISKYLPPKFDFLVCELHLRSFTPQLCLARNLSHEHSFICTVCGLTREQKVLYDATVRGAQRELDKDPETSPLVTVNRLRKICCTPELLQSCDEMTRTPEAGKLLVLVDLLKRTREKTSDRFVLISNFTSVLDVFERVLLGMRLQFLRLDGSQAANRRQVITCRIDALLCPSPQDDQFTFASKARFPQSGHCRQVQRPSIPLLLLSSFQSGRRLRNQLDWSKPTSSFWSRSSQLKRPLRPHSSTLAWDASPTSAILLSADWNPATDAQALARVWRSGQKKHCFIYVRIHLEFSLSVLFLTFITRTQRFFAAGSLEERVLQRQQAKEGLSDQIIDDNMESRRFDSNELREVCFHPLLWKLDHCQDLHTSLRRET